MGNVTDKSGAAMAGVEVLVTNEATNTSTLLASDESGGYTAVNLIPGSYKITASRSGFRPVIVPELRPAGGADRASRYQHGGRLSGAVGRGHRPPFRCCRPKAPRSVR